MGSGTTGRRLAVAAVVGAVVLGVVRTRRRDLTDAAREVHLTDPRCLLALAGALLDRGIADVQHAVSVAGVVLVLTVGHRALARVRRGSAGVHRCASWLGAEPS